MVMVKALVKIVAEKEENELRSKEMTEAIFIFIKVINYWLMEGMKYVKLRGRD